MTTIVAIETWREGLPLTRPYSIAYQTVSAVELLFVRLLTDRGIGGLGSASPAIAVTAESVEACAQALSVERLQFLRGTDLRHLGTLLRRTREELKSTPAACAAVDMALYDAAACALGVPLVDMLGRCHRRLPTSITIGIKSAEEAVREAREYVNRGFRHLKVKVGSDMASDLDVLSRLRETFKHEVKIRVDANQGYTEEQTRAFFRATASLDLEFCEQPVPRRQTVCLRGFPSDYRARIALDEGLHSERDALLWASEPSPAGIYNIKLMKCGGITAARTIADLAHVAGIDVMWGCMDESRISIAAALHAAYASPATRYLDLDGSFDLASDVAAGGFLLEDGHLLTTDAPGLGVHADRA